VFGAREGQEWGGAWYMSLSALIAAIATSSKNLKLYVSNKTRGKKNISRAQETLSTSHGPFFLFLSSVGCPGLLGHVHRPGG
jgi:hypothetical protein